MSPSLLLSSLLFVMDPAALPELRVQFRLDEPTYAARFVAADLTTFEQRAASDMADALEDRFGFLRFTTADAAGPILTVSLDSAAVTGSAEIRCTWLSCQLTIDNVTFEERLQFRDCVAFGNPIEPDDFLRELVDCFRGRLDEKGDQLVEALFSRVPLEKQVYVWVDGATRYVVLPFSRSLMRAMDGTRFSLVSRTRQGPLEIPRHHWCVLIGGSGVDLAPPFDNGVILEEQPPPTPSNHVALSQLSAETGPLAIDGIYVGSYFPDH